MERAPPVKKPVYLKASSTATCQMHAKASTRRRSRHAGSVKRSRAARVTTTPTASTKKLCQPPPAR